MPSGNSSGPKLRSVNPTNDFLRGTKYRIIPDFYIAAHRFAAADLTGANSGFWVVPGLDDPCVFLGGYIIWAVAGTNTLRVKKVLAAATSAPGAAADANNIDISSAVDLTLAANTSRAIVPVSTAFANRLAEGDKLAIASSGGTATLAGASAILRFAYI